MGIFATVDVNTTRRAFFFREFTVEESTKGWEWTHENFNRSVGRGAGVTGICQTAFECFEAIRAWHEDNA